MHLDSAVLLLIRAGRIMEGAGAGCPRRAFISGKRLLLPRWGPKWSPWGAGVSARSRPPPHLSGGAASSEGSQQLCPRWRHRRQRLRWEVGGGSPWGGVETHLAVCSLSGLPGPFRPLCLCPRCSLRLECPSLLHLAGSCPSLQIPSRCSASASLPGFPMRRPCGGHQGPQKGPWRPVRPSRSACG